MPLSMRFLPSAITRDPSSPEAEELGHHGIVQLMLPSVLRLGGDEVHAHSAGVRRGGRWGTLQRTDALEAGWCVGACRRRRQRRRRVRHTLVARLVRCLRGLGKVVDEESGAERDGILAHFGRIHVCGKNLTEKMANSAAGGQLGMPFCSLGTPFSICAHLSVLSTRTTRFGVSRPSCVAWAFALNACDSRTQLRRQLKNDQRISLPCVGAQILELVDGDSVLEPSGSVELHPRETRIRSDVSWSSSTNEAHWANAKSLLSAPREPPGAKREARYPRVFHLGVSSGQCSA